MKIYWRWKRTGQEGQIELTEPLTVGRAPGNALQLLDPCLSRYHIRLTPLRSNDEVQILLEDLGSRNGTFVNGRRVQRETLRAGDKIEIGDTVLCLERPPPPEEASPAGEGAAQPYLQVEEPGGQVRSVALGRFPFFLGRKTSNHYVVRDVKASGRHCRILRQGDLYTIEDMGSTNGTLVNGRKVKQRVLRSGDEIRIGATCLRFVLPAAVSSHSGDVEVAVEEPPRRALPEATSVRQIASAVLAFVALGVIFWGGWRVAVAFLVEAPREAPSPENLLGQAFSFELGAGVPQGWEAAPGALLSRVPGGLPPGSYAASLRLSGKGGSGFAWARLTEPVPVEPSRPYVLEGFCTKEGKGACALAVAWRAEGAWRQVQYTDVCPAPRREVLSGVFVAPPNCHEAEVRLVTFAAGTALFDQISFRKAEGSTPYVELAGSPFSLRVDRSGCFDLSVNGEVLVEGIRLVVGHSPPGVPGQALGIGSVRQVREAGSGAERQVTCTRTMYCFDSSAPQASASGAASSREVWVPVHQQVVLRDDSGSATWIFPKEAMERIGRIAFAFALPKASLGGSRRFVAYGPLGREELSAEELVGVKASELLIPTTARGAGAAQRGRVVLAFPGVGTFLRVGRLVVCHVERELDLRTAGQRAALTLTWSSLSAYEIARAREALTEAEKLAQSMNEGQAVARLQQIVRTFMLPAKLRAELTARIDRYIERGRRLVAQAQAMRDELVAQGDPLIRHALSELLSELSSRFAGVAQLTGDMEKLTGSLKGLAPSGAQKQSLESPLSVLREAERFLRAGRPATAYLLCFHMEKKAPRKALPSEVQQRLEDLKAQIRLRLRSKATLPPIPSGR